MNSVILIPARYQSTRYPGKPLVELTGANGTPKPLIQRSVEAAKRVAGASGVFVVTDDERIAERVELRGEHQEDEQQHEPHGGQELAALLAQLA